VPHARRCPVCGRGMLRRIAFLEHVKRKHPWYFKEWIEPKPKSGGGGKKKKEKA